MLDVSHQLPRGPQHTGILRLLKLTTRTPLQVCGFDNSIRVENVKYIFGFLMKRTHIVLHNKNHMRPTDLRGMQHRYVILRYLVCILLPISLSTAYIKRKLNSHKKCHSRCNTPGDGEPWCLSTSVLRRNRHIWSDRTTTRTCSRFMSAEEAVGESQPMLR